MKSLHGRIYLAWFGIAVSILSAHSSAFAEGTVIVGGDQAINRRTLENYRKPYEDLKGVAKILVPRLLRLQGQLPALANHLEANLNSLLTFYVVPREFAVLKTNITGVPFATYQDALQIDNEVWIDEAKYESKSPQESSDMVLHEAVMAEVKKFVAEPALTSEITRKATASILDQKLSDADLVTALRGLGFASTVLTDFTHYTLLIAGKDSGSLKGALLIARRGTVLVFKACTTELIDSVYMKNPNLEHMSDQDAQILLRELNSSGQCMVINQAAYLIRSEDLALFSSVTAKDAEWIQMLFIPPVWGAVGAVGGLAGAGIARLTSSSLKGGIWIGTAVTAGAFLYMVNHERVSLDRDHQLSLSVISSFSFMSVATIEGVNGDLKDLTQSMLKRLDKSGQLRRLPLAAQTPEDK